MNNPIDFISADNGGIEMHLADRRTVIRASTVEAIADAMNDHGVDGVVMGSSTMDFATENGFATDDGAKVLWDAALIRAEDQSNFGNGA